MGDRNERRCVECGGETRPIRLLDQGEARSHFDPEYAAPDADRGFWTGRYPVQGRVLARLCGGCGRIALYAAPTDEEE